MTTKATKTSMSVSQFKSVADAKLAKLRKSVGYESFYIDSSIEAFGLVDSSAYAGKPVKQRKVAAS